MKHMHFTRFLTVLLSAAIISGSVPAAAETVPDPDFSDVIVLYSDSEASPSEQIDPLCAVINNVRSEAGAPAVVLSETLTEQAAMRVAALEQIGNADAGIFQDMTASETVIRGKADLNTMICAILLSQKQKQNLLYNGYGAFGYACNEDQTLWILLMTEAQAE